MFEKQIKRLRNAYNLSQKKLADTLHVSKQTVSNWENGNIAPSVEMLMKIAAFFRVSTDFLLGLDDKAYLDISELPLEKICLIQQIVNYMKND